MLAERNDPARMIVDYMEWGTYDDLAMPSLDRSVHGRNMSYGWAKGPMSV